MGCNCGKKAAEFKYVYTAPDGTQKTYNKEIEAQAARVRNGGGSYATLPK